MKRKGFIWMLILVFVLSCSSKPLAYTTAQEQNQKGGNPSTFIPYDHPSLQYEGRALFPGRYAGLYWSGTTIRIAFSGTTVKALMEDEKGQNYYQVIVDGHPLHKLKMDTVKRWYSVVKGLSAGSHILELFKITQAHKEYGRGFTKFYGFELGPKEMIQPPPASKKRKIEFYGNSVTCGHAIEDTTGGDSGASKYENNYLTYAAITARHFKAQYSCIAKSGIGLTVSWAPAIMPEMYNLSNPYDSTSFWNFSQFTPDVVVINLLQNDQGILARPDFKEYKRRFGNVLPSEEFIISSYRNFLKQIRNNYPSASIICTLGSMAATQEGSKWPGYIKMAVSRMKDSKIYTLFFPYKNSPGHPRVKDHAAMAKSLIRFIDTHVQW